MSGNSTRKSIIKCMRKLVREGKFASITVDQICSMADISRRTFYRYFPDKYELLRATYVASYFSKVQISEDDGFWDIFRKLCIVIYKEKDFFLHALEVNGQNGFWEETIRLLYPYMSAPAHLDERTDKYARFFIEQSLHMMLTMIEKWLKKDAPEAPEEFANFCRASFGVFGTWTQQLATGQPLTQFTEDFINEI